MELDEVVLGTVFVGVMAPFVLVPIKIALYGDREHNVRGWIWNRGGWNDPDYELIQKLEQWELFYRQGCYFSSDKCDHGKQHEEALETLQDLLLEARKIPESFSRSMCMSDVQKQIHQEKDKSFTCAKLNEELSRFRFDALETHTKHVGTMITEGKKWTSG